MACHMIGSAWELFLSLPVFENDSYQDAVKKMPEMPMLLFSLLLTAVRLLRFKIRAAIKTWKLAKSRRFAAHQTALSRQREHR